jgi:hypothetical protein
MRVKSGFGSFSFSVLLLLCSMLGCSSLPFPTGVNGVALLQSGGGNTFPPPPVTHGPLAGAIITVQSLSGGQEIAQGIADSNGGFRIEVPQGTYVLAAQPPEGQGLVIDPPQQTVVVVQHQLTQVVFTFNELTPF